MAYYLNVKTPLDSGDTPAFRLVSFSGHEEISRLFSFSLEMLAEQDNVQPKDLLGKAISFSFQDATNEPRWFHGYVSRFSAGGGETGKRRFHAEVVPWLWFLTRTADCRIFANQKVPDILQAVFGDLDSAIKHPVQPKLGSGYRQWTYCVQYRETDFNFVSRLMEQEGIFYYFEHGQSEHTLVLCDKAGDYKNTGKTVKYEYSISAGEAQSESVTSWEHEYEFIPGRYAETDYEFEKLPPRGQRHPDNALDSSSPAKGEPNEFIKPDKYEIFDYPGEYEQKSEGDRYTERRMEEEEVAYDVAAGSSLCEYFTPGAKFTLDEHPSSGENGEYLITTINHSAADSAFNEGLGETYSNTFRCIPAAVTFRPRRQTPKPSIQGSQTAVVIGPKGKEIHVDKHGRVQVQFFWDRYGTRYQGGQVTPVWIRVGQIIAGKNWGAMFIPRVGQEVIVSFLEGDPDRPIITGVVYNGEQTPPYNPEDFPTRSYIKTNSSLGGDGYNEIRFEDEKDKEQIFIHAERNMDVRVKNQSLSRIISDRHQIIGWEKDGSKGGDQREMVYKDKHLKVHNNHTEHIGGNMKLLVGGIDGDGNQDIVIKKDKKELIEGENHVHVKKDRKEKVDLNQSLTVGLAQQEKVGTKHALEAGQEIHLKAGMKVVIEAGLQLTIKGPGGFVDIGPAGVTIQGTPLVLINSGGAAGVGSGSSPAAPTDAEEAAPTEPSAADNHKTGQKSTPF
ncbi:MAG: type VI secretion system tip protein TssI/VgrG [Planctomycetia bacterium]|nr:type VI secretion system tip protein TssI/VgrG [Planctomycetia bacterium]